jgi:hypothetical protein
MYYFITQDLNDHSFVSLLGHTDESGKHLWVSGTPLTEPYLNDVFLVESSMETDIRMPDFFDTVAPLMSKRLLDAIVSLGVDNLETYPVTIKNKITEQVFDNYLAVNIIGSMDVVDYEKSIRKGRYRFKSIVLDETKTMGMLCFRLHKGPAELVVHESVAKPLMNMGLNGIKIISIEEFSQ